MTASHHRYIRRDTPPLRQIGPRARVHRIPDPTTTAIMGMAFGTAFALWLVLLGWTPVVQAPGFSAMLSAGLFSLAGGGLGMLLAHSGKRPGKRR
ncbi:hypothetical protein ACFONG_13270 [Uliginosibacterium paludis]|uniref:Uncharacterized protein n=1 Tax=Uliginosibacterium paludis TaxID=1615952 RepID=A0ABV2CQ37_9RHOO